jgi:hypothetical protein
MEWTSAAITEVFVTALALSAFGIAAVIVPLYVLGVFYKGLRRALLKRQKTGHGFGRGPIVAGRPMSGAA